MCIKHPNAGLKPHGAQGLYCAECLRIYRQRTYDKCGVSIRTRYTGLRNGARYRGLAFDLTFDQYVAIVSQPCVYAIKSGKRAKHIGIDRENSAEGYTLANSLPCCWQHNRMKSDIFTRDQMLDAVRRYQVRCADSPKRIAPDNPRSQV